MKPGVGYKIRPKRPGTSMSTHSAMSVGTLIGNAGGGGGRRASEQSGHSQVSERATGISTGLAPALASSVAAGSEESEKRREQHNANSGREGGNIDRPEMEARISSVLDDR